MVKFYKMVLLAVLFLSFLGLVFMSGVSAVDPNTNNTDSLTTVEDNNLQLNNNTVLSASDNVNNLTDNKSSTVINKPDLSTVPCAVSSYISVMESYNKTVSVENGIKETHTVNNVTSVDGLVNALTNQGLKCNVIKTKSIENLTTLYKDKKLNIIVHMFIDNQYHFGHLKEVSKKGILFNDNLFIPYKLLNDYYTNISIIINNGFFLNINSFSETINKSEWANIIGKLTQKELFNFIIV